jgi:predicted PolB exonuclease-like 3'-5' exonuclease
LPRTNRLFLDTYRYGRFPHFDVCLALENQLTLEAACEMLGIDNPKTEAIRGSDVFEYYKRGQILEILNYCLRDVESTYEIFQKIQSFYPLSYADERKARNWS